MNHRATPRFWACYRRLPEVIRQLAEHCYQLLQQNPRHPSLHFKRVGQFWSVRVGLHYRDAGGEYCGRTVSRRAGLFVLATCH